MATITLSKGAAHWAVAILNTAKVNLSDLFVSGSLAKRFSPFRIAPKQNDGESPYDYDQRIAAWFEEPVEGMEVTNEGRDFMRQLLKDMGGKKELPANYHVADLAQAFDLDKP